MQKAVPAPASTPSTIPTTIPTKHEARTLVLCFDGTSNEFGSKNSNVIDFLHALKKDDKSMQMVYYQAGLGTWSPRKFVTRMARKVSKALDEMFAWNLDAHIIDGYKFLMEHYIAGDRICLFGFSRGAYTAMCLAGMIHKVGLLPASNAEQVPFAYKMYTRAGQEGWDESNLFKETFSVDVDIEFIGLWDNVNSVGFIPRRLPFTQSNTIVHNFRHAISLDERRAKFKAQQWIRTSEKGALMSVTEQRIQEAIESGNNAKNILSNVKDTLHNLRIKDLEERYSKDPKVPTDVLEVWFSGSHSDVGGGSVPTGTAHSLARIPLRWMIRECFRTKTGIMFNTESLRRLGFANPESLLQEPGHTRPKRLDPDPNLDFIRGKDEDPSPRVLLDPEQGQGSPFLTEEEHELQDALSPIHDQLSIRRLWWILELIPLRIKVINDLAPDEAPQLKANLGQGREIPDPTKKDLYVHRSVLTRMNAKDATGKEGAYVPKAKFDKGDVKKWIDDPDN
ncbi:hypothetical protein AX16_008352 [Volvariella volvacea WC 439]|nr:hypothetical protein AX16_008352 [Volvariella volvacea WC 439]